MAALDNSYSRLIAWLKIILPLTALAILSTMFFVSTSVDPTLSIPIADEEIQELANKPRIGSPEFSGVAENGAAFHLAAETAQPLPNDQVGLAVEDISASFEAPDGQVVTIIATRGTVNSTTKSANLSGGVTLATSLGYLIETDKIIADIQTSTIETTGDVVATGPLGHVSAGRMVLQTITSTDADSYELIFQGGVKMVYVPNKIQD